MTEMIFDLFRIMTLKQQKISESDTCLIRQFKKNAVRSSPDPAKIGFSPNQVRSSPVRVHLCLLVLLVILNAEHLKQ